MTEAIDGLEWIERLGGWAAILLVVRWMMTRLDKLIDSFQGAIEVFREFEYEERKTHDVILKSQEQITATQTQILQRLEAQRK